MPYDWTLEDSVDIFGCDNRYIIFPVDELNDMVWLRMGQHGVVEESAIYNADKSKVILKYRGFKPTMYGGFTAYTNEQIIEELKKDEWLIAAEEEGMP